MSTRACHKVRGHMRVSKKGIPHSVRPYYRCCGGVIPA